MAESADKPSSASSSGRLGPSLVIVALGVLGTLGTTLENEPSDVPRTRARPIPAPAPASPPAIPGLRATTVKDWSFLRGLHREWTSLARTNLRDDGLDVVTNRGPGYQLLSRTRRLPPGRYRVTGRFRIVSGAFSLAVLDLDRQEFLKSGTFTEADGRGDLALSVAFRTKAQRSISVVLSNGSATGRSEWLLKSVTLARMARVAPGPR